MTYTFTQWLFFFYFYCFLGWVWETCYVSVMQAKWVNRGFMHGPFLPIYGSGAVIVLIFTLPYRTNAVAVYFVGMISATVLEYFTGVAMERLFHVRYWDYSRKKLNLNGHICLTSSLAWGLFSVLLTMHGHNAVEKLMYWFDSNTLEILCFLLTVYISVDMEASVREALDFKELLLSLEENNAEFRKFSKRMEIISTVYGSEIKERSEEGLKMVNAAVMSGMEKYEKARSGEYKRVVFSIGSQQYKRIAGLLRRNPQSVSVMHEQAFSKFKDWIGRGDHEEAVESESREG